MQIVQDRPLVLEQKKLRGNPNWGIALPYNEVREYIRPYQFKTVKQYSDWVRSEREQGRCEGFPIVPQTTYSRKNEWISRSDFLGRTHSNLSLVSHDEDANIPEKISFKSIRSIIMQIFGIKKFL
jgi:hypothetical protein